MLAPIRQAKDTLSRLVDEIKGFFSNLILKIPAPLLHKLPRFSLKTNSRTILGQEITYPAGFDVAWNAKGGIFSRPTIIGAYGGALQGVGEVPGESEAVIPLNTRTLGGIGKGIINALSTMDLEQFVANKTTPTTSSDIKSIVQALVTKPSGMPQLPPIYVTAKTYLDNEVIGQAQFPIINGLLAEESQRMAFFRGGNL